MSLIQNKKVILCHPVYFHLATVTHQLPQGKDWALGCQLCLQQRHHLSPSPTIPSSPGYNVRSPFFQAPLTSYACLHPCVDSTVLNFLCVYSPSQPNSEIVQFKNSASFNLVFQAKIHGFWCRILPNNPLLWAFRLLPFSLILLCITLE